MRIMRNERKGMILLIVLSGMVAISLMGVSLVRITTYERAAVHNYVAYTDAEFTAWAGIERAIAEIQNQLNANGRVDWQGDLAYKALKADLVTPEPDLLVASGLVVSGDVANKDKISLYAQLAGVPQVIYGKYCYSGLVGYRDQATGRMFGRYEENGNFYSLKVDNPGGKLNVNSHIPLDKTAANWLRSNTIINNMLATLAFRCGVKVGGTTVDMATARTSAANVLRPASNGTPTTFRNIDDVRNVLVTLDDGEEKEQFINNLCTDSWIDTSTSGVDKQGTESSTPLYYKEQRAPVDINQVSKELLATMIEHIRASVIFYNTSGSAYDNNECGSTTYSTETNLSNIPVVVDIQFTPTIADDVAQYLFDTYLGGATPTVIKSRGQFNNIIDGIPPEKFPNKPYGWLDNNTWKQTWRDALKSNFDPNLIDTYWNADINLHRNVCKGDLYDSATKIPKHTNEVCFSSFGDINITSLARITANNGSILAGEKQIFVKLRFGEIIRQTTQKEFEDGRNDIAVSTVSYPVIPGKTGADYDDFAGGLEAIPSSTPPPPPVDKFAWDFRDGFPSPVFQGKGQHVNMASQNLRTIALNSLAYDGIVSRSWQSNIPSVVPMFSTNAAVDGTNLRTHSWITGSKIGNYQGAIEFWVKLADGPVGRNTTNKGLAYGLFAATTFSNDLPAHSNVGAAAAKIEVNPRQEGMVMYCYINTAGELRVSRLYYGVYWDENITTKTDKWRGAVLSAFGDFDRIVPRRDEVVTNVGAGGLDWKPHEWHHIAVEWDDGVSYTAASSLKLKVDGTVTTTPLEYSSGNAQGEFCVLNEKNPIDIFFLNGFFRDQAKQGGYFHFVGDDQAVYIPGNVTIAKVKTYEISAPSLYPIFPATARYRGQITIPTNIDNCRLGPLRWTSYPATYPPTSAGAYVLCSSDGSAGGTPYGKPSFSDTGFLGEGIIPTSPVITSGGNTIDFTADFTNDRNKVGAVYHIVPAALEDVSLVVYYLRPRISSIEMR